MSSTYFVKFLRNCTVSYFRRH